MSNKNKYQTEEVTTEETVETINETPVEENTQTTESEEVAKDEATTTPVEEPTEMEASVEEDHKEEDTITETAPTEEVIPETEETDDDDDDLDLSYLPENAGDSEDIEPEADVTNPDVDVTEDIGIVDPLPEEEGIYYCEVTVGVNKRSVVEDRLEKFDIPFIVTATGAILVGPYQTEEEAVAGRKLLLTRGLKGTVVTFE